MRSFFIILILLSASVACSQPPPINWKRCYGGSGADWTPSISYTSDNNIVLCGFGSSVDGDFTGINFGLLDVQILKLDVCGNLIWHTHFGGNRSDKAFSLSEAPDKGFLITGTTQSTDLPTAYHGGSTDGLVLKTDAFGNLQWIKNFGGSAEDAVYSSVILPDSSALLVGMTSSVNGDGDPSTLSVLTGWIMKIDKTGNLLWKKFNTGSSILMSIAPASGNDFIVCGRSKTGDANVMKIDLNGNVLWSRNYGGSGPDQANAVRRTLNGGYIVAGLTSSPDGDVTGYHGGLDAWVFEVDESGNLRWQNCIGGTLNEEVEKVAVLPDNSYVFTGEAYSTDGDIVSAKGDADALAFSTDAAGNVKWLFSYGGTQLDYFYDVAALPDRSLMLTGSAISNDGDISGNHGQRDFILVKLKTPAVQQVDTATCGPGRIKGILITEDTIVVDSLKDVCGHDSVYVNYNVRYHPLPVVQTIPDAVIDPGASLTLTTTSNGSVQWTGTGLSCYTCLSPVATPLYTTTYIVRATLGNCAQSDTVLITVRSKDTLFIPGAFTPNGDGLNDRFRATGMASTFSMKIFDRWGQLVFETADLQKGWDGRVGGTMQPPGTFVYWISYKSMAGVLRTRKGILTLIK